MVCVEFMVVCRFESLKRLDLTNLGAVAINTTDRMDYKYNEIANRTEKKDKKLWN